MKEKYEDLEMEEIRFGESDYLDLFADVRQTAAGELDPHQVVASGFQEESRIVPGREDVTDRASAAEPDDFLCAEVVFPV